MTKHILYVNGTAGPLLEIFGCDCYRCTADVPPQANTSLSLLTLDENDRAMHHVLFDVGTNVTNTILRNPYLTGRKARLDHIFLTHWHRDHTSDLNRLVGSFHIIEQRNGREPFRTPVWCRSGTAKWLEKYFDYEIRRFLTIHSTDECEPPGTTLPSVQLDTLPGVTFTPYSISHYSADNIPSQMEVGSYPSTAGFVINTPSHKAVILWDIDNLNNWITDPQTAAQAETVELLSNADYLFVDSAFWHKKEHRSTHASVELVMEYVQVLQPKQTLLVHLSGHPDGPGNGAWGWLDSQWTLAAQQAWREQELPGRVKVPNIGDMFLLGKA